MIAGPTGKTPVMVLQELMVKNNKEAIYDYLPTKNDPLGQPIFVCEVTADGETAIGEAKSKKMAKQEAASIVLEKIYHKRKGMKDVTDSCNIERIPFGECYTTNLVGELQQYCLNNSLLLPVYQWTIDMGPPHCRTFGCECTVDEFREEGRGRTKKDAKQAAAEKMLTKLKSLGNNYQPRMLRPLTTETEMAKITSNVIKKLEQKMMRKIKLPENTSCMISDHFRIISSDAFPKSATLHSIKNQSDSYFEMLPAPELTLKSVLSELKFTESHGPFIVPDEITTHAIWLTVESSPSWTFFGYGKDEDQAYSAACLEALKFFVDMSY